jgi:predicted nucleic acid-binding protein
LNIYPDTSFLFSRYLADRHSEQVDRRMLLRPRVYGTPFHRAELANALFQWAFRGKILYSEISYSEAHLAYEDFEQDCAIGVWIVTSQPERLFLPASHSPSGVMPVWERGTLCTLHVAAALELKADRFWTFDERQTAMAKAAGLTVA